MTQQNYNSDPSFFNFVPELKWQKELIKDFEINCDYSKGFHTFFCSGTIGSGKSLMAAHLIVKHCLEFKNATVLIARKAMPDLKDTLFSEILTQLDDDNLRDGIDYFTNETRAQIKFRNGSLIIGKSWADRKYKKLGSLKLSAAVIEEAAENDEDDKRAFEFIEMRMARQPWIKKNWMMILTNPDSQSHFIYTNET